MLKPSSASTTKAIKLNVQSRLLAQPAARISTRATGVNISTIRPSPRIAVPSPCTARERITRKPSACSFDDPPARRMKNHPSTMRTTLTVRPENKVQLTARASRSSLFSSVTATPLLLGKGSHEHLDGNANEQQREYSPHERAVNEPVDISPDPRTADHAHHDCRRVLRIDLTVPEV